MRRSSVKRWVMPALTTSLRWITPSICASRATTSGVPPERATLLTTASRPSGAVPPRAATQDATASAAPLRMEVPFVWTPLIRVSALNGMNSSPRATSARSRRSKRSFASTTIDRPSGVSSARDESWAASASSRSGTPPTGMNSVAWRLPSVIVPVLSSSRVSTSPAASTARPLRARTLRCTRRSMPAIPIADRSAPIVVGINETSRAMSTVTETSLSA